MPLDLLLTLSRDLATNIGITFKTPEEFFRNEPPEKYERIFEPLRYLADHENDKEEPIPFEKRNSQELVIFCGSPGAGKSTFYWQKLKPLDYERINQDLLKTVSKLYRERIRNLTWAARQMPKVGKRLSDSRSISRSRYACSLWFRNFETRPSGLTQSHR